MNGLLKQLWQGWVKVAKKIGDFQARLMLTIFYFVLILPMGLIARWFADPLALKKSAAAWTSRTNAPSTLEDARRQF
ncbi:MAG: hypothetical protein EXR70_22995 [Deltaproteobacteria bacterium]|nr:hypothetical protein [Deltaproteobacteria bacterium]